MVHQYSRQLVGGTNNKKLYWDTLLVIRSTTNPPDQNTYKISCCFLDRNSERIKDKLVTYAVNENMEALAQKAYKKKSGKEAEINGENLQQQYNSKWY